MAYTPTPDQKQAAETIDRNLVVVAGAGSGKTKVLVDRYLYLLQQGVPIQRILAITFTRKAALEMKDRSAAVWRKSRFARQVNSRFQPGADFYNYSFCQRLVAEHPDIAYVDPAA